MIGRTPQIVIVYKAYYCIKMVLSCTLQQKTAHWHYIFVNPLAPEIFEFYGCVFPPTSHFYGYFIRENEVWNHQNPSNLGDALFSYWLHQVQAVTQPPPGDSGLACVCARAGQPLVCSGGHWRRLGHRGAAPWRCLGSLGRAGRRRDLRSGSFRVILVGSGGTGSESCCT